MLSDSYFRKYWFFFICVNTPKKQCIGVCVLCMVHIGYTIHNTHKKSGYQKRIQCHWFHLIALCQLNEINDIESFFGIKGLKEDNVETKAMIVLSIFSEFSYMKLYKYSIFLFISSKLNYKN
jgi:hypothetical protein